MHGYRAAHALSITLIVASACGGDADLSDGGIDARVDASADAGVADAGATVGPGWIDVHVHCGLNPICTSAYGCCGLDSWNAISERFGFAVGALVSTQHYAVRGRLGDATAAEAANLELINEVYAGGSARDPRLWLFPSLECWYDTPLDDPGWVDACIADVDRWIAAGARGFKDHIGKQFDNDGNEAARWLGAWNRLNGFCAVGAASPTPNLDCMQQPTARYPAMEAKWREVLQYILVEARVPVVSHAISYGGEERCWDPTLGEEDLCWRVTKRQLVDLAIWLMDNVDPAARRRFIAAHLGFLVGVTGDSALLLQMLGAGISAEPSANIGVFSEAGCAGRRLFALHPDQILFGTDRTTTDPYSCAEATYGAWIHAITGAMDDPRSFDTCEGTYTVIGMDLGTPHVDGCINDVPDDALARFTRDNFLRLYE